MIRGFSLFFSFGVRPTFSYEDVEGSEYGFLLFPLRFPTSFRCFFLLLSPS